MSEQDQTTEPIFREQYRETIKKITNSKGNLDLKDGEFENTLISITKSKDAVSMRDLFDAYYWFKLRAAPKDKNTDEIRMNSSWLTDSTAALADARKSGKEDLLMVFGNPYRPLSETQKFFRDAVDYHPVEPNRRTS